MDIVHEWISAEFQRLAEILYDYDHNLRLEMVPPEEWVSLVDKSKVFRVVDTRRNQIVLFASSVSNPEDILSRVWSMDQNYQHNVVAALDARNRAVQALQLRKINDEIEAEKDLVLFIAKNTKSRWKHNGVIRDEHFRNLGTGKTYL